MPTIRLPTASTPLAVAGLLFVLAAPAAAQAVQQGYPNEGKLLSELLALVVVATILESALTTIFQWRVYREFFNNKAMKTLVMIAAGGLVVWLFNYDVFGRVMTLVGARGPAAADGIRVEPGLVSGLLSALVLAGGSAAVNTLLNSLGIRRPEAIAGPKPPPLKEDEAWLSVTVAGVAASVGPVEVFIDEIAPPQQAAEALAGVLPKAPVGARLRNLFFASRMRVPSYGGRVVKTGQTYRIGARIEVARDANGNPVFATDIRACRFASRAIVDLVLTPTR